MSSRITSQLSSAGIPAVRSRRALRGVYFPSCLPITAPWRSRALPAKPRFTVLRSACGIGEMYEILIGEELKSRFELRFASFGTEAELLGLTRELPVDLTVLYLWNVSWMRAHGSLVDRAVDVLGRLTAQHRRPIIAIQGLNLAKRFEGTGVTFLLAPVTNREFLRTLHACLGPSPGRESDFSSITVGEINALAKEYFAPERISHALILPSAKAPAASAEKPN